jgi:hypothetical protein
MFETPHGVYEQEGMSAQGTLLARAPLATPTVFTPIAALRGLTPPALTRNPIETTNHNNLDDSYIVGIRRHGEMTASVSFLPAHGSHDHLTGLQKAWHAGTRDLYQITFPDGTVWEFAAYVTNISPDAPTDDLLSAEVTFRPSGAHTWTPPEP